MLRLNNLILLAFVLASALGTVSAQNKARKLYQSLEAEQERARLLEVEYDQLQLELSTWASHGRIEEIARARLKMVTPVLNLRPAAHPAASEGGA
jgi:cell division protein FtsL